MKITKTKSALLVLQIASALLLGACSDASSKVGTSPHRLASSVPVDVSIVKPTCTLTPAEFAGWFTSGTVAKDGVVNPANGLVDFETNCAFYKWSWQMFLWQMSPNGGSLVFNTPPFYDLDSGGNLTSDATGKNKQMRVRGIKSETVDGTGQAGVINGVLMTQDVSITPSGSLVYYAIHVNDVYAYMTSGINSGGLTGLDQFSTTAAQLKLITDYAKTTYGVDIEDADALTLELKSSWVRADAGIDLSDV